MGRIWTVRRVAVSGFLALLAVGLPGCGNDSAASQQHDRVRAVVLPYLTNAPFHIAAAEGYFEHHGLEVEFVRLTRDQDVMTALASGEVDVAPGMLTSNDVSLVAQGAKLRIVGAMSELDPEACASVGFMARRELVESGALEDPARLRTLRFDVPLTLPGGYWLDLVLAAHGLSAHELQRVDIPPPAAIGAMQAGAVDVVFDSDPYLLRLAEEGDASLWWNAAEIAPGYPKSVLKYGPRLLEKDREVGARFAAALLMAASQYAQGKTPRNLELVQSATGLDPDTVRRACWPKVNATGRIEPARLRGFQEWLLARGLVPRILEDGELFDTEIMEVATQIVGAPAAGDS